MPPFPKFPEALAVKGLIGYSTKMPISCLLIALSWLPLHQCVGAVGDVEVLLLDGRILAGSIESWHSFDGLRLIQQADSPTKIPNEAINSVTVVSEPALEYSGEWRCELWSGSVVYADLGDAAGEDGVSLRSPKLNLPIVALEQIRRITPASVSPLEAAPAGDADLIGLQSGDTLSGSVISIGGGGLRLGEEQGRRSIALTEIRWISPAASVRAPSERVVARFDLVDGGCLAANSFEWRRGRVVLRLQGMGSVSLDAGLVARAEVVTYRRTWLTDLAPCEFSPRGFLEKKWSYQIDRNSAGRPLRAMGRVHRRGIGLHSECRISWEIPKGSERFCGMLAMDDSAGPIADADVWLRLDDRLLIEHRGLRSGQKPRPIDVDVTGHRRLTIEVGFGGHGHVGDRVNLLAPEFIAAIVKPGAGNRP